MTDDTEQHQPTEVAENQPGQPSGDVQAEEGLPKEGETSAETDTEQTEQEQAEKADRLSRHQRRQRDLHRTKAENYDLKNQIAELKAQFASKQSENSAPKASDFPQGEYDPAFVAETVRHTFRQELEQEKQRTEHSRQSEAQAAEVDGEWKAFAAKIAKENPGLQKLAGEYLQTGEPLLPHVGIAIANLPNSTGLLEHILKDDPELISELNEMAPHKAVLKLAKINHQLVTRPNAKRQTSAPAPLTPPKGGSAAPVNPHTGPEDMDAYVKWRRKQDEAKRR